MSSKRAAILIIGVLVCAPLLALHYLGAFREVSEWLERLFRQVLLLPQPELQRLIAVQYGFYTFMAFFSAWVCMELPRLSLKFAAVLAAVFLTLLLSPALAFNGFLFEPFSGALAAVGAGFIAIAISGTEKNMRAKILRQYFAGRIGEETFEQLAFSKEVPALSVRREVTVLSCRLLNTADVEAGLEADIVEKLGSAFLKPVAELLVSRGAYLEACGETEVRALFGYPIQDEDHAATACKAALDLPPLLAKLAGEKGGQFKTRPAFGAALATGDVTCGLFGFDALQFYGAIGRPVDFSSQLCSLNLIYGSKVLLDNRTFHLAKDAVEVRPMEMIATLKTQPVGEIYELLAGKDGLSETEARARDAFWQGVVHLRKADHKNAIESFQKARIDDREDAPLNYFIERAEAGSKEDSPAGAKGRSRHARALLES